ncbi:MAG: UPF0280 family protein [bacterium]|nr:UPF0280 family protein [bacterium]
MKYRRLIKNDDLYTFRIQIKESDILISAEKDLKIEAEEILIDVRRDIEDYISRDPIYLTTFEPYKPKSDAPPIIKEMAEAGLSANVGPMAAVAGAIAEKLTKRLRLFSEEVIVENGGDIFMESKKPRKVGIYAKSGFFNNLTMAIEPEEMPISVCTSSGVMGRSISLGKADVSLVLAKSGALADAWATRIGNLILEKSDITKAIKEIEDIKEIQGAIIIKDDQIGLYGKGFRLVEPS